MHQVKLNTIRQTDNGYMTPIDKSHCPEFKQLRQAKAYLVKVSKHLTSVMYEINDCFKQIINCVQSYVFSFPLKEMQDYTRLKHDYDNKVIYLSARTPETVFIINGIRMLCVSCIEILKTSLNAVGKKMKYTGSDTTLNLLTDTLYRLHQKLTDYPPTKDDTVITKSYEQFKYRSQLLTA